MWHTELIILVMTYISKKIIICIDGENSLIFMQSINFLIFMPLLPMVIIFIWIWTVKKLKIVRCPFENESRDPRLIILSKNLNASLTKQNCSFTSERYHGNQNGLGSSRQNVCLKLKATAYYVVTLSIKKIQK